MPSLPWPLDDLFRALGAPLKKFLLLQSDRSCDSSITTPVCLAWEVTKRIRRAEERWEEVRTVLSPSSNSSSCPCSATALGTVRTGLYRDSLPGPASQQRGNGVGYGDPGGHIFVLRGVISAGGDLYWEEGEFLFGKNFGLQGLSCRLVLDFLKGFFLLGGGGVADI